MNRITTIIIDDESLARQRLKRLLEPYHLFNIIAEASNGQEGLLLVEDLKPELIFLDIEMPALNGFEMLARLTHQPKIIFTTAYDQYAIKAFEENSIDYLLKPIENERLEKSIKKINLNRPDNPNLASLQELILGLKPRKEIKTLTVKIGDKILLVKLEDIWQIEAEEKYTFLKTTDGSRHLTDFTLAALQEKLPENFVRIHRSSIINSDKIKEIRKGFNGSLIFIMTDKENSKVSSSRSYSEELRGLFGI